MPKPKVKLRACKALNWDYLLKISAEYDSETAHLSFAGGMAKLAHDLTQTGDEDVRDRQLSEFLHCVTDHTSTDSTEKVLKRLAQSLHCDYEKMRQFAKENGIKVKMRFLR